MIEIRLNPTVLQNYTAEIFENCGMFASDAAEVASSLVATSLRGVDSHGIMRIPLYVTCLRNGTVKARPDMKVVSESTAAAVLDADDGMGHVAMTRAIEKAVDLAKGHGVASVGVRNSTHYGASGHYAMMASNQDCIGLVWTNGPAVMPPPGGSEARVSNNPLAIAVPCNGPRPLLLDVSLSVVARGKVRKAIVDGAASIPADWMLTADGRPTTVPSEALNGLGIPIGGHKGYGLAFMGEILAGLLMGAAVGTDVKTQWHGAPSLSDQDESQLSPKGGCGHMCVVWSVASFIDVKVFKQRLDDFVRDIKSCPTVEGQSPPLVPGEPERNAMADRRVRGIPVSKVEFEDIIDAARSVGVETPDEVRAPTTVAGG